jgi:signal transduction histidine kinase
VSDRSLRSRVNRLTYGLIAFVIISVIGASIAVLSLTRVDARVTGPLFLSVVDSGNLYAAALNQETGVRGYALTGQVEFLEPYTTGVEGQTSAEQHLATDAAADPALVPYVKAAVDALNDWHETWAVPTVDYVRTNGPNSLTTAQLLAGKAKFDTVRASITSLTTAAANTRKSARHELQRIETILAVLLLAIAIAAVVLALLIQRGLRRGVLSPINELTAEMRVVVEGDLSRVVTIDDPPELARLAADIDSMRRRLVAAIDEAVAARDRAESLRAVSEEKSAELSRSNDELEQFAYLASHDLQEPLRKVVSFCQLLDAKYHDQLDERGRQYIDFAVDGAQRMQQLITDLLAFSRVGRSPESGGPVDLNDVYQSVVESMREQIAETGADVQCEPLPTVFGQRSLYVSLLSNLIGNAIKFHGDATPIVRLTVHQISFENTPDSRTWWSFAVTDNGIGIAPEYADRVFLVFQRLHSRDAYEGTGIGLALCRKIVEYYGGTLLLDTSEREDAELQGARFVFTLPEHDESATHPSRQEQAV